MAIRFILSDYVEQAIARAVYDKLEDGNLCGSHSALQRDSGVRSQPARM